VRSWRVGQVEVEETRLRTLVAERTRVIDERQQLETLALDAARALVRAGTITAAQLAAVEEYRQYVRRTAIAFQAWLVDCDRRIAEQRNTLLEARRRAELLERLKRRRLGEWRAASEHEQESLAAELFLAKVTRALNERSLPLSAARR
jgi:hypothetical protein